MYVYDICIRLCRSDIRIYVCINALHIACSAGELRCTFVLVSNICMCVCELMCVYIHIYIAIADFLRESAEAESSVLMKTLIVLTI